MRQPNSGLPDPEAPIPIKLSVSTSMEDRVQRGWGTRQGGHKGPRQFTPNLQGHQMYPTPSTPMQRTSQALWLFLGVLPSPSAGRTSPARVLRELPPAVQKRVSFARRGPAARTWLRSAEPEA